MSDWLDLPLVAITREVCRKRHTKIGEENGTYMANGTMRVLRAIWRRARRQHPELPEPPTANVDFYPETGGPPSSPTGPHGGSGIQQIANPVRRDFYIWLAFSGCRAGETMSMEVKNIDLEHGIAKYPITKTDGVRNAAEQLHGRAAAQPHRGERRGVRRGLPMGVSLGDVRERSPGRRETDREPSRSCSSSTGRRIRCGIRGSRSPIRRSRSPTAISAR